MLYINKVYMMTRALILELLHTHLYSAEAKTSRVATPKHCGLITFTCSVN